MIIREILAKAILSKSQVYEYALNPYVGCGHDCSYCYARFMKRFTGHRERWGDFVDVKINAPELLAAEVGKKRPGRVWISGVCDPYQPLERKYRITGRCLEILTASGWPFTVQTKSALVLRDLEILKKARKNDIEVGFSIATADDGIRKIFEPVASPIEKRIEALGTIRENGIRTFAMIAPLLPGAEGLARLLKGKADYVLVDRMNYHHADRIYKKHGLQWAMEDPYFERMGRELKQQFKTAGIPCQILF
ncbi:MAG: radical SAM protein [Syntrophales bacterium]|nr:radical SAM protein [Syntrophales bacterium]MDD5531806.1 radical SAM protein [Syntrophales bacterium]